MGVLSTHLYSCSVCSCKKVACPAYNKTNFDNWFPYQGGQMLLFRDSTGNIDTITINNQSKSGAYEANKGCGNGVSGCYIRAQLSSMDSSLTNNKFFTTYTLQSDWAGVQTTEMVEFHLYNFTAYAVGIQDTGLVGVNGPAGMHSRIYTNLSLGATNYGQVQVLETDTANFGKASISKVYLARNIGVIAYEEYPSGIRWVKL